MDILTVPAVLLVMSGWSVAGVPEHSIAVVKSYEYCKYTIGILDNDFARLREAEEGLEYWEIDPRIKLHKVSCTRIEVPLLNTKGV